MHGSPLPLPVAMLIVFGVAKLLGEIFARLHLPPLAGEIVAGALVGPSMLGWIAPNEVLKALSDLGVLFLLFSIGLEVKVADLLRVSAVAAGVAALGELAPFAAGWAVFTFPGAARATKPCSWERPWSLRAWALRLRYWRSENF